MVIAGQPTTVTTLARWPLGVALTSWRYLWRTTPMNRREIKGRMPDDWPPELPDDVETGGVQTPESGAGPLFHRFYSARIRDWDIDAEALIRRVAEEPDRVAPSEFASFHKTEGHEGRMRVNDEYLVRMAGPWNGPVRVALTGPDRFRLVTLEGHLEAGQIEFRAFAENGLVAFEIESWARSKDRVTDVLYDRLRMSKEVQFHMWLSTLEHVIDLSGGRRAGHLDVETRRLETEALGG